MTVPFDSADPIVLDSSMLVAYERMLAPNGALREGQSWVSGWLVEGVPLLVPALSLAIASHECSGKLPELEFLLRGDADQVLVVPLAHASAVDVGAAAASTAGDVLEVEQVVWCATGHDTGVGTAERWQVATYWPDWYTGKHVPIIAL